MTNWREYRAIVLVNYRYLNALADLQYIILEMGPYLDSNGKKKDGVIYIYLGKFYL